VYLKLFQDGYIDAMCVSSGICPEVKTVLQLVVLPRVCDDCFDFSFDHGEKHPRECNRNSCTREDMRGN
jgi:hypothetical protein